MNLVLETNKKKKKKREEKKKRGGKRKKTRTNERKIYSVPWDFPSRASKCSETERPARSPWAWREEVDERDGR